MAKMHEEEDRKSEIYDSLAGPSVDRERILGPARTLDLADLGRLSERNATPVVSNARKFVVPVPALGDAAEPLVYPPGHAQAGQPILDWEGKAKQGKGLVFFNEKDSCWQAVQANGAGVIIINGVTEPLAEGLYGKIETLGGNPQAFSIGDIKEILEFAFGMGLNDVYDSSIDFVRAKMTPARNSDRDRFEMQRYGFVKRDDRDVSFAVAVEGPVKLVNPDTVTPQVFQQGAVIVQTGNSIHGVQPDIFFRDYRHVDGRLIGRLTELVIIA